MQQKITISIHAPRVGRDDDEDDQKFIERIFQSTRPVWGATMCTSRRRSSATISIHAPRVGRDGAVNGRAEGASRISIHAPRVGRDHG